MNVAILKKKKVLAKERALIAQKVLISQAIGEILTDPDFGLEMTEYMKKRLERARKYKGKLVPFSEIKKRYL